MQKIGLSPSFCTRPMVTWLSFPSIDRHFTLRRLGFHWRSVGKPILRICCTLLICLCVIKKQFVFYIISMSYFSMGSKFMYKRGVLHIYQRPSVRNHTRLRPAMREQFATVSHHTEQAASPSVLHKTQVPPCCISHEPLCAMQAMSPTLSHEPLHTMRIT